MAQKEQSPGDLERDARSGTEARHSSRWTRLQVLGWFLVALFIATTFIVIEGRQPTWEDELYVLSTAWSILHGGPSNQSALGIYPHQNSIVHFYGPVSFNVAITLLRIFGLKTWPWRAACFLFGISLIVISSAFLLHLAGVKRGIVLAGASAVAVSSVYCTVLPGRWDPMTVGLILSGIAVFLYAVDSRWGRLLGQSSAAGILCGLAAGSTPRALLLLAAAGFGVVAAALIQADKRVRILIAAAVASVVALATDAVLLASLGMTPWSWLRFVRRVSTGDEINSSPLLGGTWGFEPRAFKVITIFAMLTLIVGFIAFVNSQRKQGTGLSTWKVALTVMATMNVASTVLFASRFLNYTIFWLPLLTVSSFSWIDWDLLQSSKLRLLIASLICLELLLPATLEARRMYVAVKLWDSRDPQALLAETRKYVPPNSIVFGPVNDYFIRVEQSGSRYLYFEDDILPGLDSGLDSPGYRQHALDVAACTAQTFVLWPTDTPGYPIPPEVTQHPMVQVNAGQTGSIYDFPAIYRIARPAGCAPGGSLANAIKPFKSP
jgi:hypothetical protein